MIASVEEQIAAWNSYVEAKKRADKTLRFEDGRTAVTAWKRFANLYLSDDRQIPPEDRPSNVTRFPVHKTRAPGDHDHGRF